MKKFSTWLIILATIALAAGPVLASQLRAELARWHIAAATNAVELRQGSAEQHLQSAREVYADVEQLRDYWLHKLKRTLLEEPTQAVSVLQQAIAASPLNRSLIPMTAAGLWKQEKFEEQIQVWELLRSDQQPLPPGVLNELAYARALTAMELDQALEDINQALRNAPNQPAYRDTRAWVLFQMGRASEALEDADFAVKAFESSQQDGLINRTLVALGEQLAPLADDSLAPGQVLTRQQAGEALWGAGALYYHRARILEGLLRQEEAQADWNWLAEHHLPQDDRLF